MSPSSFGAKLVNVLSWVVPLSLRSLGTKSKLMRFHTLSKLKGSVVIDDISINAKVWYWIVDLVTQWLLLVLVLSAASG